MLIKAEKEITKISDNEEINSENYFESLSFIESLYLFINKLKLVVPLSDVHFEPTFKGRFTCEKYNIRSTEKENDMKYFIIDSMLFLEDTTRDKFEEVFNAMYNGVEFDNTKVKITLK